MPLSSTVRDKCSVMHPPSQWHTKQLHCLQRKLPSLPRAQVSRDPMWEEGTGRLLPLRSEPCSPRPGGGSTGVRGPEEVTAGAILATSSLASLTSQGPPQGKGGSLPQRSAMLRKHRPSRWSWADKIGDAHTWVQAWGLPWPSAPRDGVPRAGGPRTLSASANEGP